MSLSKALDDELVPGKEPGLVHVQADGASATVHVVEADKLGVRVRSVKVTAPRAHDIEPFAAGLPDALGDLPTRIEPVEVDARLGGATLRTPAHNMRGPDFIHVEVRGAQTDIRRLAAGPHGDRNELDWTMTRDQLGRVLDGLLGD